MRRNIPREMRELRQWVCSYADKIPLNPATGHHASVTDPATWASFDEALNTGLPFIGFVLTTEDPFSIIDLDNKPEKPVTAEQWAVHERILNAFDSYTERSASGRGYHIVVRGKIPAGIHRESVEVYSSERYMICTGAVVRPSPVTDCQALLDQLVEEMTPAQQVALSETDETLTDEELFEMAMGAENGAKFDELCKGDWAAMGYPSQSEADFALLSIIAFYTQSNEQVRRLFRMTALGKRPKAAADNRYLDRALRKIRAKQPEPVDYSALLANLAKETLTVDPDPPPEMVCSNVPCCQETKNSEATEEEDPAPAHKPPAVTFPHGLVGAIAGYIYETSVRPVPEVALAAAITLLAGIGGRSYNISGTGLNQYLILLAKTGSGKEGATAGIDRLLAEVRRTVPMVDCYMGPGVFASGQALVKTLDEKPCFLSLLGEFGLTLKQMCDPRANAALIMLRRVLLDLYGKSGWTSVLRSSVYADKEKNTKAIQAPCLTILGESTPESFFEGLDASHVAEGLIPRFSILEYKGDRPPKNPHAGEPPNPYLVSQLAEYTANCLTVSQNHSVVQVQVSDEAKVLLDELDTKADRAINRDTSGGGEVDRQLWNRAHLKALRLSALLATGCNPYNPIVDECEARWAIEFVVREVEGVSKRYRDGEVGMGDVRCAFDVRRAISAYLEMSTAARRTYKVPKVLLDKPVVNYNYIYKRVRLLATFKNDRRGVDRALKETLASLVERGELQRLPAVVAKKEFGCTADLFVKGEDW